MRNAKLGAIPTGGEPMPRYPRPMTATTVGTREAPRSDRERSSGILTGPLLALVVATVSVVVAFAWGDALLTAGTRLQLRFPPFDGVQEWHGRTATLPAVAVAAFVVVAFVPSAERMSWRALLAATAGLGVAWAVALARIEGPGALTMPLLHGQYLTTVPRVGAPLAFLSHFTDRITTYNIHTQGHPPGMVMLQWALDRLGFAGVRWNAALVISGGALANVVALVAVRTVAGTVVARRAAPFLVLAPAAIWWSAGDAFFALVTAAAVGAMVAALYAPARRADRFAALGGLLFAATALLSYGLILMAAIPVAVAWSRRRVRPLVVASAVAVAVLLVVAALTGFAWWEGLAVTRTRYFAGVASRRPYDYFLVANLAVLAVAVGPAAVAGLGRLRDSAVAPLVGGALLAVGLADLSGMSKGEVERIWIPFVPFLVVAAVTVARRAAARRVWLTTQAMLALVVATGIRSKW